MIYFKNQTECIDTIIDSMSPGKVQYIFLIGSYAKHLYHKSSDVDLIVVSNEFKKISNHIRRKILLSSISYDYPKLDLVCLTEQEFEGYKKSTAYKDEELVLLYKGDY